MSFRLWTTLWIFIFIGWTTKKPQAAIDDLGYQLIDQLHPAPSLEGVLNYDCSWQVSWLMVRSVAVAFPFNS